MCGDWTLQSLYLALSSIRHLVVTLVLTSLDVFSDSLSPVTVVSWNLLRAIWISLYKFLVALADVFKAQERVTYWMLSCDQLIVHKILWYATIIYLMNVNPVVAGRGRDKSLTIHTITAGWVWEYLYSWESSEKPFNFDDHDYWSNSQVYVCIMLYECVCVCVSCPIYLYK